MLSSNTDDDLRKHGTQPAGAWGYVVDAVVTLTEKVGGLFTWTSTMFRHLEGSRDPTKDRKDLIENRKTASQPLDKLYELYDWILACSHYSDSGDTTMCIWDSRTGELACDPITRAQPLCYLRRFHALWHLSCLWLRVPGMLRPGAPIRGPPLGQR